MTSFTVKTVVLACIMADDISRQAGTMALVPQVVDAVKMPVHCRRWNR